MFVLGIQGSPRRKGNSAFLLSTFLREAERLGGRVETVDVGRDRILPCREYVVCEKKGFCPIDDDMKHRVYGLLRAADVIVAATPIFFYNCTAQFKALIDRSQTLWARRYRLKLADPNAARRRGFLLSVAATQGKQLFDGLHLTMQYFFDAVSAQYHGSLTYRGIEKPGDMARHPDLEKNVAEAVEDLLSPFRNRRRVLFVSQGGGGGSQMAAAFAKIAAGDGIDVRCAGVEPAAKVLPEAAGAMQARGIDMGYLRPEPLDRALENWTPEKMVVLGKPDGLPAFEKGRTEWWEIPAPEDPDSWNRLADEVRQRVEKLVGNLENELKCL